MNPVSNKLSRHIAKRIVFCDRCHASLSLRAKRSNLRRSKSRDCGGLSGPVMKTHRITSNRTVEAFVTYDDRDCYLRGVRIWH
jgi:hypothetical protein